MLDPDAPLPNDTIEEAWNVLLELFPRFKDEPLTLRDLRYAFYMGSYSTMLRLKKQMLTGQLPLVLEQVADIQAEFAEFIQHLKLP